MAETLTLYGFGDADRSGKVRWLAQELGLELEDIRVRFGENRKPPYTDLNPMGRIPTARFQGEVLTESTSILHTVAEAFDEPKLWVGRGEPGRRAYLYWLAAFGESLEGRLVECAVSQAGLIGPEFCQVHQANVADALRVLSAELPAEGYLCGEAFTIADIVAGYSLRLGVQTGLVERDAVEPYLGRLVARPAAVESRIFAHLD